MYICHTWLAFFQMHSCSHVNPLPPVCIRSQALKLLWFQNGLMNTSNYRLLDFLPAITITEFQAYSQRGPPGFTAIHNFHWHNSSLQINHSYPLSYQESWNLQELFTLRCKSPGLWEDPSPRFLIFPVLWILKNAVLIFLNLIHSNIVLSLCIFLRLYNFFIASAISLIIINISDVLQYGI